MATKEEVIFKVKADLAEFKKSMDGLKKIAKESSKKIEKSMDMDLRDEGSRAGKSFSNGIDSQMKAITNTVKNELKRIAEQASEIEIGFDSSGLDAIKKQLAGMGDNILTASDMASSSMTNNANAPNDSDSSGLNGVTADIGEAISKSTSMLHSALNSIKDEISKTFKFISTEAQETGKNINSALNSEGFSTEKLQALAQKINNVFDNIKRCVFKVGDTISKIPIFETLGNKIQYFAKEGMDGSNKVTEAIIKIVYHIGKIPSAISGMVASIKSIRSLESACNVVGRGFIRLGAKISQTEVKMKKFFNAKHATHFGKTIANLGVKIQRLGQEGGALRRLSDYIKKVVASAKETSIFKKVSDWIKGTGKEADKAAGKLNKLKSAFSGLIGKLGMFFGLYQLFSILKDGTQDAIQYEAAIMNLERTLGKASETLTDFADNNAASFGISKKQVAEYGNIFSVLLMNVNKDMAKHGDTMDDVAAKTADMSQQLLEAAGVISGALGYDTATVLENLRSGILGSSEAVDQYGLSLKIANLEQSKTFTQVANGARSWNDLTTAQQQYIIAQEIINQTTANYGGIVKNTASMHNQFTAQLANTKLALGNVGKAIWTAVLPALTKLMAWLEKAFNVVAKVMSAILGLFGIKVNFSGGTGTSLGGLGGGLDNVSDSAGSASDALGNAADAASGAGDAAQGAAKDTEDAAKRMKRALAGFDQINVLSLGDDDSSGGSDTGSGSGGGTGGGSGGGSGGGTGGGNLNDALTNVETTIDTELTGPMKDFVDWVNSINFDPLKESFNGLKESIKPIIETCGKLLQWFLEEVLGPLAKWTIEEVMPRFFDTLSAILDILAPILDAAVDAFIVFNDKVLIPIAKWVADKFLECWDAILEVLQKFADWLNGDGAWLAEILGTLGGAFAVIGEVVLVAVAAFKTASAVISGIATAVELAGAAFTFLTSPVGLVVTAIAAVIAIIVLCIQHWDEIKEAAGKCWDWIVEKWNSAGEWFKTNVIDPIVEFFTGLWDGICDIFSDVADWFGDVFKAAWEAIKKAWDGYIDFYKGVWDGICKVFSTVGTWFKDKFTTAWNNIKKAWDGVSDWFSDVWDAIKKVFETVVSFYKKRFQDAWDAIKKIWEVVSDWFSDVWEAIKKVFSAVVSFYKQRFQDAWDAIKKIWEVVSDWFSDIWDAIKKVFNAVASFYKKQFQDAWDAVKKIWETVSDWFGDIWDGIKKAFNGVKTWFSDTFSGAWEGIKKAWSNVTEFFSDIWDNIKGAFDGANDWSLPKPKMSWDDLKDKAKEAIDKVKEKVTGFTSSLPKPSVAWDSIKDTAKEFIDKAKEKVTGFTASLPKPSVSWDSIKDTAKGFIDKAKEKVTGFTASLPKPSVSWDSIKDTAKTYIDKAKEKVTGFTASLPKPSVSWSSIATSAKSAVDKAKEKVTKFKASLPKPSLSWSSLATSAKSAVDAAKKKVTGFSAKLPQPKISWNLKTLVSNAVSGAKKLMNFSWSLPKPKIPKFTAKWTTVFGVKIPSGFTISWHAKGGIFNRPTILGNHGFGEAGAEAVLPLEKLWDQLDSKFNQQNAMLSNAIANSGSGGSNRPVNITLKINDIEMGKAVIDSLKALSDHSGEIDLPL